MFDLRSMTENELFNLYRKAIMHNNEELAKNVIREFGRRGAETLNGEPFSEIFRRNPFIEKYYNEGKEQNQ